MQPAPPAAAEAPAGSAAGRARNTAIFSVLTGLSRVAGLVREIVAAAFYGTLPAASAFTLAFQVPNLIRALVADAALSSAFVPVFSELLEQKRRREAIHAASALAGLLLLVLTAITLLFILVAPWLMPLFTRHAGARRPDHRAVARAVPDRRAARAQRASWWGSSTRTTTSRSPRSRRSCGTW